MVTRRGKSARVDLNWQPDTIRLIRNHFGSNKEFTYQQFLDTASRLESPGLWAVRLHRLKKANWLKQNKHSGNYLLNDKRFNDNGYEKLCQSCKRRAEPKNKEPIKIIEKEFVEVEKKYSDTVRPVRRI